MSESLKVLIVEDNVDTRANLCDILELDGHSTAVAGTAAEASERLQENDVDIVILDRKLPDGLAERLLPELRELATSTDFIVVTGYADLDSTIAALRSGAADYILKPINPDALRASLGRISERRRIESELHREQNFANQILATSEAIVLVLDLKGRIVRFNPYLTKISGWELSEAKGKDWFSTLLPEIERDKARAFFNQTLMGVETKGIINGILTKAGSQLQIRWSNTTLKDQNGKMNSVLSVGLDVTGFIEAQNRSLQSERLAAIGQTMTALAHESRNSLQRIQASAEILELELGSQPQALKDIKSIQRAARDLHGLLEELRSFAAPINLRVKPTRVASIWRLAWRNLLSTCETSNPKLIENIDCPDLEVVLDSMRLEQVFRNLFENAIAACGDDTKIYVTCRCIEGKDEVEITISDNGPGWNTEQEERLFEAFYTTKPTGTGLGLAIVRRIIEAHNGVIKTGDSSAGGATFIITLPLDPFARTDGAIIDRGH